MSGMHAELFSYHLALQLQSEQAKKALYPLAYGDYQSISGSEFEPQVAMTLSYQHHTLYFWILSEHGYFRIHTLKKSLKSLPELERMLVDALDFEVDKESVELRVERDQIHKVLSAMARAAKALDAKASAVS